MERNLEIEMSPVEDPVYGPYWQSEGQHQELRGPGQQRFLLGPSPSPHRTVTSNDGFQPYSARRHSTINWRVFAGMCFGVILVVLITLGILFLIKETVKDGVQRELSSYFGSSGKPENMWPDKKTPAGYEWTTTGSTGTAGIQDPSVRPDATADAMTAAATEPPTDTTSLTDAMRHMLTTPQPDRDDSQSHT